RSTAVWVRRSRREHDRHDESPLAAEDREMRFLTRPEDLADDPDEILGSPYGMPVDPDDHVAAALHVHALEGLVGRPAAQAGTVARTAREHRVDQRSRRHLEVEVAR